MGARGADHVDIGARDAGDRKALIDRRDRRFHIRRDAIVLLAGQALERNRGEELVVPKQASRRVVMSVMNAEDVHRVRNSLSN